MQRLVMGGNAALRMTRFDLAIDWPTRNGSIDVSAYMLAADGRVRGDQDMIFYNQRSDVDGSVRITDAAGDRTCFAIDLHAVPRSIDRIVFCVTIETGGPALLAFDGIGARISADGEDLVGFSPDLREAREVAMRIIELYRRNGTWKVRADGQGFNDGLAALARSFGIDVSDRGDAPPTVKGAPAYASASAAPETTPPHIDPVPSPVMSEPASRGGQAGPIRLDAGHPRFDWQIDVSGLGPLTAQLTWRSQCGGYSWRVRPLDLALGCIYELSDGKIGVVQDGGYRGHFEQSPFVQLLPPEGELPQGAQKLRVNTSQAKEISRLALFAFIRGAPNWQGASIDFELSVGDEPAVAVALGEGSDGQGMIALAQLDFEPGAIIAHRLSRYHPSHPELARDLGWDLAWRSDPRLHLRGTKG